MKKGFTKNIYNLLEKASESALLGVDLYNKPKTSFRSGAFIVLMTIAWTSLLHAILEKNKVKYYYLKGDIKKKVEIGGKEYFYFNERKNKVYEKIDGDKKAWELLKCAEINYGKSHPIYKNIGLFIKLRNKIEHRFMPEIDSEILGECQALILNFENELVKNFGNDFSLMDNIFIPLQLSTGSKKIPISSDGMKTLEFIKGYRSSVDTGITNSQEFSFKVFIMPNIGKNRNTADVAINFVKFDEKSPEEMAKYEEAVFAIKNKEKNRYKPAQVLSKIFDKTGITRNMYWHNGMWKKYSVRVSENNRGDSCNNKYCEWYELTACYIYFDDWIDFLIEKELSN